ncbi:hypothetical protein AB0G32_34540 [Streptomyces sp. NPDC023723]|uniref:hypothetical protein n=1 Tax=Streptomyces sp. NPDC023723 TaxID=3154323 RepID=UPI0033DBDAB3
MTDDRHRAAAGTAGPHQGPGREDLYPQDKQGKITAKGGVIEWIHLQSGTAQLLPRLIARRTRGPLFLTDRKAPAGTPTLDVCPASNATPLHVTARRSERIRAARSCRCPFGAYLGTDANLIRCELDAHCASLAE